MLLKPIVKVDMDIKITARRQMFDEETGLIRKDVRTETILLNEWLDSLENKELFND